MIVRKIGLQKFVEIIMTLEPPFNFLFIKIFPLEYDNP